MPSRKATRRRRYRSQIPQDEIGDGHLKVDGVGQALAKGKIFGSVGNPVGQSQEAAPVRHVAVW